jgi:hypothetical protein
MVSPKNQPVKQPGVMLLRLAAITWIVVASTLVTSTLGNSTAQVFAQASDRRVFLPLAPTNFRDGSPLMVGVYPPVYLGTQSAIDTNLKALDLWAGKGNSLAGIFLDFNDPNPNYNVRVPLELLWNNGYTGFINLITTRSARDIAQGKEDTNIQEVAAAFGYWMALAQQKGQSRFVFLAPLPEMNITNGNTYGGDPASFITAYRRIQDIFEQEFANYQVPFSSISWVFAPNGVDEPGMPNFEAYYPGQDRVDIVAFSSYNWGYCVGWAYDEWQLGPDLYLPFAERMHLLAPGKPIFIGQTASTSEYPSHGKYSPAQKNQWFIDAYSYLAGLDGVRAVMYFNIDEACDWSFYKYGSLQYDGYRTAVNDSAYTYMSPPEIQAEFMQP